MITAKKLIKNYGNFKALKGISFKAPSNSITALLGPNGAGKTTTLRILAGYLVADEGEIEYSGEKYTEYLNIRRITGYVPENNPVYEDLEVSEYLELTAKTYSVGEKEVKTAIERCSLKDVVGKKIGTLSKGYRQRVSLAKSILHNPKILLLDEPTTGLDPNQAEETRNLIKELKKDKTVIISTHILSEAENLCDNIIIINKGEISAEGKKEDIIKQHSKNLYTLIFEGDIKVDFTDLTDIEEITEKKTEKETEYTIKFKNDRDMRKELLSLINSKNIPLLEIYRNKITLDEIFAKITRGQL